MNINIALAADENYFPGLLGTVASIIVSADQKCRYEFYVIDGGISSNSWNILRHFLDISKVETSLNILQPRLDVFEDMPKFHTPSKLAYARLLLPNLLKDLDTIIYVDSDILFLKDIALLNELNIGEMATAVAKEFIISILKNDCPNYQELGLNPQNPYFNSGLMLMNLEKFRNIKIAEKTISYLDENRAICKYWDQTALNVTLYEDFLLLDQSWNVQSHWQSFRLEKEFYQLLALDINYHFVTKNKPWMAYSDDPASLLFYRLLRKIGYDFETEQFTQSQKEYEKKSINASLLSFRHKAIGNFQRVLGADDEAAFNHRLAKFWKEHSKRQKYFSENQIAIDNMLNIWEDKIDEAIKK